MTGLGLAAYQAERQALEARVADELAVLAMMKTEQIEAWLAERQADVRLLAVNRLNQEHFTELFDPHVPTPRKNEFAAFLADNLVGLQSSRVGYREVSMVDANGVVVISTNPEAVGHPISHRAPFDAALAAPDGAAIHDIHRDPATGQPAMAFAHTMRAIDLQSGQETETIIGVVITIVDMDATVYPLLGPLPELGDTAETFLVRKEDESVRYLSHLLFYPKAPLQLTFPAPDAPAAARGAAFGQSGELLRTLDYRGRPVLAVYRPIPSMGWGFVAKQDLEQAFAPVQALERRLAVLAGMVLALISMLALFLARTLTHPIEELAAAAQTIAGGDLNVSLRSERRDELGDLARAFQHMADALAERQRRASIATRVLETLNASPTVEGAFQAVTAGVRAAIRCESMSLALWEENRGCFQVAALDQPLAVLQPGACVEPDASDALADVLARRPHLTPDLSQEQDKPLDRLLYQRGYRSRLNLPLLNGEHIVGMLSIGWLEPQGWRAEDLPLLNQFASALALALERSRLFEEVRRRAEELERAYLELRRADQLKDAFIRNITHELRTPVATLSGFTELLLDDDVSNLRPDQRETLDIVADQTQRLRRLVNDVVALHQATAPTGSGQPLHLVDVVRASLEEAQQRSAAQGTSDHCFVLEEVHTGLRVRGDRRQLSQVFDNLLDNAVKFSPEGGQIRVRLFQQQEDDVAWVVTAVEDPGIGIAPEDIPAIWERFVQLDGAATRRFGGAGLGLAVVKEIVEAHGGRVWVESQTGTGSTFFVALPRLAEEKHA
ncbi:MAG: HAMP domain-containing protein [Caldilineae bacterium]|nr:MAG: HAMP domain-containing protein [Caldilineae bacterium]